MICSDPKLDSHRFKDIIDEAIAEGRQLLLLFTFKCSVYECFHFDIWCIVTHFISIAGELKSTKAYTKWAKKISVMEPPTNPLERRVK
jgi:DnaJ homolog subfamily C member 9